MRWQGYCVDHPAAIASELLDIQEWDQTKGTWDSDLK